MGRHGRSPGRPPFRVGAVLAQVHPEGKPQRIVAAFGRGPVSLSGRSRGHRCRFPYSPPAQPWRAVAPALHTGEGAQARTLRLPSDPLAHTPPLPGGDFSAHPITEGMTRWGPSLTFVRSRRGRSSVRRSSGWCRTLRFTNLQRNAPRFPGPVGPDHEELTQLAMA